jgi:hypothetical protein
MAERVTSLFGGHIFDSDVNQWQPFAMPNPFNYRCPQCGSADEVVIDAYLSVWLDGDRPHLIQTEITAQDWYPTNPASCNACDYSGTVADFEPSSAQVIPLRTSRR